MKVRLARMAGFCMGVRRAMELALQEARRGGDIHTYGPLIHNPQVLDLLESKGVGVLRVIPGPGSVRGGTVIIRAHGVPPGDKRRLKEAGFDRVVEGTCPRVIKVQAIIRMAAKSGRDVVIVGDASHPEVVGLKGHGGDRARVVACPEEVEAVLPLKDPVVVAQTTQSAEVLNRVVEALERLVGGVEVHDTICEATHRRQEEVRRLAAEVDGVVVVGGRESGNTRRLYEIALASGKPAWLVETDGELPREELARLGSVGVTAGASTPNWMIKKVVRELGFIRGSREGGFRHASRRVLRFMVRSQMLVALGAGGMSLAAGLLQGIPPLWEAAGTAMFYVHAMHILNMFLDKEAGQYNEPDRSQFLVKHRRYLIGSGVFSALAALFMCAGLGWLPFLAVMAMSALGLIYSLPVIPGWLEKSLGIHTLKDIPGSKTFSPALAWAAVTALLPPLAMMRLDPLATLLAFLFVGGLVLVRCSFFDILDVQGDLIVGRETLPILLGEKRSRRLIWVILAGLALLMTLAPALGILPGLAWWMLLPICGITAMQTALHQNWIMPGDISEGMVDLNFLVAGIAALLWYWAV